MASSNRETAKARLRALSSSHLSLARAWPEGFDAVGRRVGGMRIAYVLTSLGVGGAERQVVALAERMAARGHAVSLLLLRPRQPE